MNLKQQINQNKFNRMMLHPEALVVSAYYTDKKTHQAKQPIRSFLVQDWLYCEVETKTENTFVKYYIAEDSPRKDSVAFHTIGKLWVF